MGSRRRTPGNRVLCSSVLESLKTMPGTLSLYESPYRIGKLLAELGQVYPERRVVLARELTKKFEESLRGTAAELLRVAEKRALKGEFVVLLEGNDGGPC